MASPLLSVLSRLPGLSALQSPGAQTLGALGGQALSGGPSIGSALGMGTANPASNGIDALLGILRSSEAPARPKTPLEEALYRLLFGGGDMTKSVIPSLVPGTTFGKTWEQPPAQVPPAL